MASWMSGNTNPIYAMRDSFDLQGQIKEGKVLGPQGAKTDLIQKLALTAQPSKDQLSILKKVEVEGVTSKEKSGFTVFQSTSTPTPTPTPAPKKEAAPAQFANVYRETQGFAAVA